MSETTLKSCPFCGGKAILETSNNTICIGGVDFNKQYLGCKTLGCFGFAWAMGRDFSTKSTGLNIKAWNRRTP